MVFSGVTVDEGGGISYIRSVKYGSTVYRGFINFCYICQMSRETFRWSTTSLKLLKKKGGCFRVSLLLIPPNSITTSIFDSVLVTGKVKITCLKIRTKNFFSFFCQERDNWRLSSSPPTQFDPIIYSFLVVVPNPLKRVSKIVLLPSFFIWVVYGYNKVYDSNS